MRRAAVIGAGLGGLAAAATLARRGWSVRIFDGQDFAGGKAGSIQLGPYRFDSGPSLVTMPGTFAAILASLGRRLEDCFTLVPLDPICRYWFADGRRFATSADQGILDAEAAASFDEEPGAVKAYLSDAARIYAIAGSIFLERPIHEASTWLDPRTYPKLLRFGGIDPLRSLHAHNASLFRDPALVQLFDRYATYNGSDPWKTPGTMAIIPHVEYSGGGYAIREGITAIPRAFETICREEGVEFHLNEAVSAVCRRNRRITSVMTAAGNYEADAVIADIDPRPLFALLGEPEHPRARRYSGLAPSSSGLVFFWGMAKSFPELAVNNIFFSSDYRREFRELFDKGQLPGDPTIYLNISSKETLGDAPAGGENWFVLVNAPPDRGQDWATEVARLRVRVLATLSERLGDDVAASIDVEATLDPKQIAERTGSPGGSLYGIASNSPRASFARQRNRVPEVPGLYFCGGSSHPGGGMPLVLQSGKMAAELADRHEAGR